MIGLIDCNSFFVSCERIFNPRLRRIPVIVLSNNDGCAVAISSEAKQVGIRRGDPYFKIRGLCEANNVAVLSGNHRLYGDISARVMATIASVAGAVQVYSIDEAFIPFDNWPADQLEDAGREIVRRVRRNVGIPTALGIAPTMTLAKLADRFAKKYPGYRSVCLIGTDRQRRRALELTPVGDVWGIGRKLTRRLGCYGIATAADLANRSSDDIDQMLNIVGRRTWMELNGIPAVEPEDPNAQQCQMCCSRSFADDISDLPTLEDAFAAFATIVSRRLRERNLAAGGVGVFMHTNHFHPEREQYHASGYHCFDEPTNDTMTIADGVLRALRSAYRPGYGYKRAGVLISDLADATHRQQSLFINDDDRRRSQRLMTVLDELNASSLSHDTVHIAAYMPMDSHVRCEQRSPLYSTRLADVITVIPSP
ncbi:MAG: Y-family DNA polymerase [Muribaculaceae bacterium]|nr:Y-family DNA polymerase [Muribaculaceae bacterium]